MFGLHVSDLALAKADSIIAKCDAGSRKYTIECAGNGRRVEYALSSWSDQAARNEAVTRFANEFNIPAGKMGSIKVEILSGSAARDDAVKADAAADVIVNAKGVVVSVSVRAKKYVKMGEKLSSSQMDDLSEAGFSVREQK